MSQAETKSRRARFGVFEVDLKAGELRRQGVRIKLQGRPFDVLALLLADPGEVVTREVLREQLWPSDTFVDFDHGLNNAVNKLREALGDSADSPRYVETLPRRGYRFVAPVEWLSDAHVSTAAPPEKKPAGRLSSHLPADVVALLVAVLVLVVSYLAWQRPSPPTRASSSKVMLAVLPFENLGGDPQQEFFSDGLTEEMITRLGQLQPRRLGVIASTSAMHYKASPAPIPEIAHNLGVDFILEGSVRQDAGRVRVTAHLVQVSDQTQLWTETYDRELTDIFAVQDDVAKHVADSLALELLPPRSAPAPATSAPTYEAYLKGTYFARQGKAKDAIRNFQEAISLDANFAPAYAGLANSLVFQSPATQTMPAARQAALKALELDPNLPAAQSALGLVKLMYEWDWPAAEQAFQRALELNPADPETHLRYSNYLAAMGRLEEAVAAGRRAQQLDPLAPLPLQATGRYLTFMGRIDDAIAEYNKTLELDPNFYWGHLFLAFAYEEKGDYDRWLEHQVKAWLSHGDSKELMEDLQAAYRAGGHEGGLRWLITWREEWARSGILPSAALALDYAKLGEKEKALTWLERAYEAHTRDLIYLNVEPQYDPIRDDPRFQEVVRRIGLPPHRAAPLGN